MTGIAPRETSPAGRRPVLAFGLLVAALGLAACGTNREALPESVAAEPSPISLEERQETVPDLLALEAERAAERRIPGERSPEELYLLARHQLTHDAFDAAAQQFDDIERLHPYSVWATRGQLMAAYANYEQQNYDQVTAITNRFISLHPGNPEISYAYYLRALAFYDRISDVGRDQGFTLAALDALAEVNRRFPGTAYARDARLKIDLTLDQLAGKDMTVGRFYLRQGHFNAAINRFRTVVTRYQTTSHAPEALHRLTEAYLSIGLVGEAQRTAAVLGHNYPGSDWYQDSYRLLVADGVQPQGHTPGEDDDGLFGGLFSSVF